MFTGIIEALGKVQAIEPEGTNIHFTISSALASELKIDQSVAHDGICLTVVSVSDNSYTVTAIQETLNRTRLNDIKVGDNINLERCTKVGARLDGHIVQGHVDQIAACSKIEELNGSWKFFFEYEGENVTVEKGSITINGTSLTVVDSHRNMFSVAIIPYTFDNTTFKSIKVGSRVNLEFDIVGKYVARLLESRTI